MENNSGRRGKSRIIARLFIAVLAVCLALTAVPFLSPGSVPVAEAANVELTGTSKNQINTALVGYAKGTVVDLILNADIDLTDTSTDTFTNDIIGIVIPEGITVNLYMNGKRIIFNRSGNGAWQLPLLRGIHNKGTLNIYSGSSATSPSRASATSDASAIYLVNTRTNLKANTRVEYMYARMEGVYNEGILNIEKNVTVYMDGQVSYSASDGGKNVGSVSVSVTGVQNTTSASATVNYVNFSINSNAGSCNGNYNVSTTRIKSAARAFSFGINGGSVTVNGKSVFYSSAYSNAREYSNASDFGKAYVTLVAYGVASSGHIYVNGGEFSYFTKATEDKDGMDRAQCRVYEGAVAYQTGMIPVLSDGSVTPSTTNAKQYSEGSLFEIYEAPVTQFSKLPMSGVEFFESKYHETGCVYDNGSDDVVTWPTGTISAGQFYDETGNLYTSSISTTDGTHPTAIVRGAIDGTYRVHIIYRYWNDNNKTSLDTAITTNDGTAGYSFSPLTDGADVVKAKAAFSGLSSGGYVKAADSGIKYISGGDAYNANFWRLKNITYSSNVTGWFSEVDFGATNGTIFKSFETAVDNTIAAGTKAPIYVFVDYVKRVPGTISMSVKSNTAVYTGKPILASTLGASVRDEMASADCTADYDLDKTGADKIPVTYKWTGKTAAGVDISGEGSLPVKVGTYEVQAVFADDTVYNKDGNLHKNREAYTYSFALTINPAEVTRGTLPTEINLTYGQKLSEVLNLSSFVSDGVNGEKPEGRFSFKNSSDGSNYKNAGKGSVEILWSPTNDKGDYKQTTFTVNYTVGKATLRISPLPANVVYGDDNFKKAFSSFFVGLVANDNNDEAKAQIEAVLKYEVNINGNWFAYKAGETPAGEYAIRAVVTDSSIGVLSNYDYVLLSGDENPDGRLTVEKRGITVVATAIDRPYDPDNDKVSVRFEITDGKLIADDVSVGSTLGTLANNNAGTRDVQGIYKETASALLTGGKRENYYIDKLLYATGDKLTAEISKAKPSVSVPSLGAVFYRRTQTLNDIKFDGYNNGGIWQWVDNSIVPTVAVGSYAARFVPADQTNYETITADIPLTVNPTPVVISYKGVVSYGDNVPNITAYTYSAPNDPDFSIDAVTTTGNITVSTDYKVGSVVNNDGYAVYISAPNFKDVNGNYTFTTQNGVITVKARTIVFTVSDAEITYGENFSTDIVNVTFDESRLVGDDKPSDITSNGDEPRFTINTEYNYLSNYNSGVYELTASRSFTSSKNYDVQIVNGKLTVKKADLKIKAKNITVVYGSDVPELSKQYELIGAKKGDTLATAVTGGEVKFGTTYAKGATVNTEGYSFYIDISGATFANYNVSVENGVITVAKANPKITEYPTASIVYGQTLADAVFTGGASDIGGTYVYDNGSVRPAWQEDMWTIYTATFVPDDTVNYNTVANIVISLKVNKKQISGDLSIVGNPMIGSTLSADVSGLDPDTVGSYTFVWTMNGTRVGTGTTLVLDNNSYIGKTVTLTATATGYYEGTASCTTTQIAQKLTDITEILNETTVNDYFDLSGLSFNGSRTVVYNGTAQFVSLALRSDKTAYARIGNVTVKYNGSAVAPVKAGSYTVTIDISTPSFTEIEMRNGKTYEKGTDTVVYSPVSNLKIGTLVIEKAPYNVTVAVNDKIYDGYTAATANVVSETGAVMLAGNVKDDVKFGKASFMFGDANVGTAKTVTYTDAVLVGSAADNYKLVLSFANGGKASITPRELLVRANPVSREYEDGNYTVDVSFEINNASIAATDSSAVVRVDEASAFGTVDNCHAGTRKVSLANVNLIGAKSGNYVLKITNLDNLTVQIHKATPSYPIPYVGDVTYDAGRHLSDIGLGDSRWSWSQDVRNTVPGAGSHVYTAIYTPSDTANYATVSYDVSFDVKKAPVEVRAASFTVTYGDIEPTYYTTVKGLTGSDTVKTLDGFVLLNCAYTTDSYVSTYQITINGQYESDNYTFTYVPGSVTVKPRTVYVTATAVNREYKAGDVNVTVNFSTLSNVRPGDEGNVSLASNSVTGTVANDSAGKKTVDYILPELSGVVAQNYELKILNPNVTVEILKAHLAGVILPTSAVMSYGDKLSTAKWTSAFEGEELGTFSMKDPMSTPAGVGTFDNVYKVIFTPFNSMNYATEEAYITLTVERAVLNLELSISGVLSSGNKLYVVTNSIPSDAPQYIVYNWYRVDNPKDSYKDGKLISYNTSDYTLTEADEGKYIIVVAQNAANSPYIVSAECISDGSVEQPKLSFWQKILKWFYKLIATISAVAGRV